MIIGRAAAIALAQAGAHVICLARTVGALEELDDEIVRAGGSATLVPLNLRDGDGIDRLGASIFERWGRLDALLANAGTLGVLTPISHLEPKVFTQLLEVSITANWRPDPLARSLCCAVSRRRAGRCSSRPGRRAQADAPILGRLCHEQGGRWRSLTLTYAAECEGTKVKVNLFNPGATRTAMRKQAMPGEDSHRRSGTPDAMAPRLVELLSPSNTSNGELFTPSALDFDRLDVR